MYKSLIGNIHEIYEKEQEVLEDMKLCLLKEEDNDVVIDKYLKYVKNKVLSIQFNFFYCFLENFIYIVCRE